jgi:hypothetical protein
MEREKFMLLIFTPSFAYPLIRKIGNGGGVGVRDGGVRERHVFKGIVLVFL